MYSGWTQVAFESELGGDVTPVDLDGHRLVAVRTGDRVSVFDATCPHRGAHLGHGGTPHRDGPAVTAIRCPFHGHLVRLGRVPDGAPREGAGAFRVAERPSALAARGVFVLTDPAHDTGLAGFLTGLDRSHHVVEAFTIPVPVPPEYVIENAFDVDHFVAVHALERRPELEISSDSRAVLRIEGVFDMVRRNQWMRDGDAGAAVRTRFLARVFSPMLVAAELGPPEEPSVVLTAATPAAGGGSVVRVTIGLPRRRAAGPPTVREVSSLVSGSRTAFAQDLAVWEHLDTTVRPRWTAADRLVRAYRDHCLRFRR
ncbi:MAG TPA: Rieske 2Fe-2S domain-containing protein [Pseudonocardiaceae bacterium]